MVRLSEALSIFTGMDDTGYEKEYTGFQLGAAATIASGSELTTRDASGLMWIESTWSLSLDSSSVMAVIERLVVFTTAWIVVVHQVE